MFGRPHWHWHSHWHSHSHPKAAPSWSDAEVLVAEASAFLRGWAPDVYTGRNRPVPSWAWLNPAVHQDYEAVARQAASLDADEVRWGSWEWATCSTASVLMEMAGDDPEQLGRIQVERLLPLELALIADGGREVCSPAHLLALALDSLRGRPIRPRRIS